jgi:hypothetical protein
MKLAALALGLGVVLFAGTTNAAPAPAAKFGIAPDTVTEWAYHRRGHYAHRRYSRGRYSSGRNMSRQAGIRCGNYGCWRNDRRGRPTGERMYFR